MTTLTKFPDVTEIAARTPADRDRVLDVIRIASLISVVLGHAVMAISIIQDHVLIWDNLLTTSVVFQAMTWLLQIMPLFFFAGAAASAASWSSGTNWGGWLMKRCTRLFRPVFYYLVFWAAALTVLHHVLPQHVYEPIAGVSTQLLWFLGAYVLVLAAMPMLCRITTAARLVAAVSIVYGAIAVVDIVRLHWPTMMPLGYLNLAVWLIPAMCGIAYRNRVFGRRAATLVAAVFFTIDIALVHWGPYQISMVGTGDHHLSNTSPPSLLLAGHSIILCMLVIAASPMIARWAQRPRVWWATAIGNSGAMTLYLWHMPVLLGTHLAFDYLGSARYPGEHHFVAVSVLQLLTVAFVVAALFIVLRPLENDPLPGWDHAPGITSRRRGAVVGVLLCVAGVAILASIRWGLKDDGLVCMAVAVGALLGARAAVTASLRSPGRH